MAQLKKASVLTSKNVPSPLPTAKKTRVPARLSQPKQPPEGENPKRSETAVQVGKQIRALRLASDMPASALARRAGLSRSMLSSIEHGLVSPSIEALDRISVALDMPMSRFFVDQVRRTDFSFVPSGKGLKVEREGVIRGYNYELIGHLLSGNLFVEPYRVELTAEAEPYTTFQHPGTKMLYFLSGKLKYRYGSRLITVGAGDTLLFDATALHGAEAILERPASYLSVVFTLRE